MAPYRLLTIFRLASACNMNAVSEISASKQVAQVGVRLTPLHLAVLLSLLAFGVRCIRLDARPLWLDEASSAWFAAQSWHDLWTVVPTYETHPPFYYSLLKLWTKAFGDGRIALRSLSVLFGVATVPIIIAAALELDRHRPTGRPVMLAAVAGFLAACSPILVAYGQEARPYPLFTLSVRNCNFRTASPVARVRGWRTGSGFVVDAFFRRHRSRPVVARDRSALRHRARRGGLRRPG